MEKFELAQSSDLKYKICACVKTVKTLYWQKLKREKWKILNWLKFKFLNMKSVYLLKLVKVFIG